MKRLVVSHAAQGDLRAIARYSEQEWGIARRKRYMDAIRARFKALRRHPMMGSPRADISRGYRSLISGSHTIFYRVTTDEIVIMRVLHQHMDVRRHFGRSRAG